MKEQVYKVANQLPAPCHGGFHRSKSDPQGPTELSFLVESTEDSLKSFDKLKIKPRRRA